LRFAVIEQNKRSVLDLLLENFYTLRFACYYIVSQSFNIFSVWDDLNDYQGENMGKVYQTPPIVEALCEFRFQDSNEWDLTLPGLFYNKIQHLFPQKREQRNMQIKVDHADSHHDTNIRGSMIPMVQFYDRDETCLVQLTPTLLTINHLKPYSDWIRFKKLISDTLTIYQDVANLTNLARIGLRYINQIDLDPKESLYDYLEFKPCIPTSITQETSSLLQRVELPFNTQNGKLSLTLATVQDEHSCILDLDFVTLDAAQLSVEDIPSWLEIAHETIEDVFEASITDMLREKFKEPT